MRKLYWLKTKAKNTWTSFYQQSWNSRAVILFLSSAQIPKLVFWSKLNLNRNLGLGRRGFSTEYLIFSHPISAWLEFYLYIGTHLKLSMPFSLTMRKVNAITVTKIPFWPHARIIEVIVVILVSGSMHDGLFWQKSPTFSRWWVSSSWYYRRSTAAAMWKSIRKLSGTSTERWRCDPYAALR